MNIKPITLYETKQFTKFSKKLLGDEERKKLIGYLKENPKEAERLEKEIREVWGKPKDGKDRLVVGEEEVEEGAGKISETD